MFAQPEHNNRNAISRSHSKQRALKTKNDRIVCPIFKDNKYPYHGIGFKLGDPFALTYKFYASKHFSIALDAGKTSSGLYSHYYRDKFNDYVPTDTLGNGSSISYLTGKVKADWVSEIKCLYSIDAAILSPGLQIYGGLGIQGKSTELEYVYQHSSNEIGRFQRNRSTLGQTTIIGIEYNYFQLPISAFMEMELFIDVLKDPGLRRFQGGVGLRYVFR